MPPMVRRSGVSAKNTNRHRQEAKGTFNFSEKSRMSPFLPSPPHRRQSAARRT
jgi:hypothetical protein